MIQTKTALIIVLVFLLSISFSGCEIFVEEETTNLISEKNGEEIIEQKIYDVLNKTQVDPMFAPTIGNMVVKAFHNYQITWKEYNSNSIYSVRISGNYCPNPDIPNLSMDGWITYLVDIETGDCIVMSDPHNITATFLLFILN